MMSLGLPIGLWALAALAPLVAIYVFHRRSRSRPVSSLLLWDGIALHASGHTNLYRPPVPLSLLLEVLAIVVMALGLADLRARLGIIREAPVVILDNSLSMGAEDGAADPAQALARARIKLRELVARAGTVRLLLAEESPRLLGDATIATLERLCAPWRADAPAADLPAALAAALQLSTHYPRIAIFTDGPPGGTGIDTDAHPDLRWIGTGRPLSNIAIVDAGRSQDQVAFDIRTFADLPMHTSAKLLAGPRSDALHTVSVQDVALAPDQIVTLRSTTSGADPIVALQLGDDSLGVDNTVFLAAEAHPPVRVRVEIAQESLRAAVESALLATGSAAIGSADPELIFTDAVGESTPGMPRVRFEGSAASTNAQARRSFAGPFVLQRTHQLVEGIDLTGVIWTVPDPAAPTDSASLPLILADTVPVILEEPTGDVLVRIDVNTSTVTKSSAWPSLIWNIVRWRVDQRPGLARANIPLGQPMRFIGIDPNLPVSVVRPDGSRDEVPITDGIATILSTQLGIHHIEHATRHWDFAVQPIRLSENDLRSHRTCDLGTWPPASEKSGFRSLTWLWSMIAIGVLSLHSHILREWNAAR